MFFKNSHLTKCQRNCKETFTLILSSNLMRKGGFILRSWTSNSQLLRDQAGKDNILYKLNCWKCTGTWRLMNDTHNVNNIRHPKIACQIVTF